MRDGGGTVTGTQAFTFDLNGNRTQQVVTGTSLGTAGTTNYAYNAADQLCWSGAGTSGTCTPPAGATSYSYDGQGNQTSGGNTYNGFDQLTGTTSGGTLTHAYAGTTNNERYSSTGTSFTTSLLNQVTQETTALGVTRYVRDPNGTLIGMQDNSGANYYATLDNVGSVLLMTDNTQAAAAAYTYDPYGVTLTSTGPQAGVNHYRYATGYTDPTGLIKLGARYYNPTTRPLHPTRPQRTRNQQIRIRRKQPTNLQRSDWAWCRLLDRRSRGDCWWASRSRHRRSSIGCGRPCRSSRIWWNNRTSNDGCRREWRPRLSR